MKFKRSKFNHQVRKIVVSCDPRGFWPSFKPWNQLVRRDASTSLTSFAISRVRTKGIMSTFFRPISPRTIFTAWCSDQRPNFSGINLGLAMESDGTWWNYILGVGTWDYPQELDGKTWETWKNNKPFKAFQALRRNDFFSDFPSFQIPSITIQQNLALSEIKDVTIYLSHRKGV